MLKMDFVFTKTGAMRFISHLDLMRLFMRAMRRARIPMKISEGFNPHPKLSILRALKLGVESGSEEATVALREPVNAAFFQDSLNSQLPSGIRITSACQSFRK
jgi:radical SAM-linked protein